MEKPRTHDPNSSSSAFPHALGAGARGSNALKLVKPANMKELIEEEDEREAEDTYGYKEEGQASTGLADLLKGLKL